MSEKVYTATISLAHQEHEMMSVQYKNLTECQMLQLEAYLTQALAQLGVKRAKEINCDITELME